MDDLAIKAKEKSGLIAALLNVVCPGAGYIYCKSYIIGIIAFIIGIFLLFSLPIAYIGYLLAMFVDGLLSANRHNKKLYTKTLKGMIKCPRCSELIQKDASICKHCKTELVKLDEP